MHVLLHCLGRGNDLGVGVIPLPANPRACLEIPSLNRVQDATALSVHLLASGLHALLLLLEAQELRIELRRHGLERLLQARPHGQRLGDNLVGQSTVLKRIVQLDHVRAAFARLQPLRQVLGMLVCPRSFHQLQGFLGQGCLEDDALSSYIGRHRTAAKNGRLDQIGNVPFEARRAHGLVHEFLQREKSSP